MPKTTKILPIKPFQETLYGGYCGPASLKMVLDYYGLELSEQELADLCNRDPDLGTSAEDLQRVATNLGFEVTITDHSEFSDISDWLRKDVPVIVNWFTRGRQEYSDAEVPDGHYSLVVGLDDKAIYLQDPEIGGLRKIDRDDFYRVWFDFSTNHITKWEDLIIRQIVAIRPIKR